MANPSRRAAREGAAAPPLAAGPTESAGPVCAEYTPELQLRILGIDLAALEAPILDLGCGGTASLVVALREAGIRGVIGLDPRAPEAVGFVRASWFDVSFPPASWRTLIAHQSFALHFLRAHLSSESEAARFAHKYVELVRSLEPGGRFFYAPGLPFVEEHLDPGQFRVARRPAPVAGVPDAARELAGIYGSTGLYAARVERLR